ncbi:TetR/AcrR family transcriptional regulator [Corynebacterium sp.]|jgi:AcrR family transcriptional regulator|uniref:TetR/AcrR family transcriptional regulator n=1 Tax=Corynebacterium sp. TaxID=1720 RepID=UPI0025BFFF6B|nr:TetR/AcrR family transcriptional regulator [Corynebacterium sp.]
MAANDALSLREQKKEETRRALARASAELLLSEGSDGMTVAAVAERAGVSTRTFHNYFPRREDALLFFIEETIDELRQEVEDAPADEHPLDIMQRLVTDRVDDDGTVSDDPGTLLNLRSIADHLSYITGPDEKERVMHIADGLMDAIHERTKGSMSRQASALMTVSCLTAGAIAVESRAKERGRDCMVMFPSWASTEHSPAEVLEEGFTLLRDGFGG